MKTRKKQKVGKLIRAIRMENNRSQVYIAKILKCSQSHVSKIESGNEVISLDEWAALAKHFNVPFAQIAPLVNSA